MFIYLQEWESGEVFVQRGQLLGQGVLGVGALVQQPLPGLEVLIGK